MADEGNPDVFDLASKVAKRLNWVHQVKADGVVIGLPVTYPGGERVSVYVSADRPGLVFVSDFEGGRRRAMMAGVEAAFDAEVAALEHDPPVIGEGLSIYVRVPPERLLDAVVFIANASARCLCRALTKAEREGSERG